jgi:putative transcription antitermination factor YqgF
MQQKYFAIDYGTQRIGTAFATTFLAEPLEVVPNNDDAFQRLHQLITQHVPDVIVVGLSEKEMAEQTKKFVAELGVYLSTKMPEVPLFEFADETLSSVEVYQKLYESGKRDIRQHGAIDHYAAAQILQEYLDLHQNT